MGSNSQALGLLKDVISTAELLGVEHTRKLVVDARNNYTDENQLKNVIKKIVCDKYNFSFEVDLVSGTSAGLRMEAITVCCVAFNKYLQYNSNRSSQAFGKDPSNIRKRITWFNSLKYTDKQDTKTLERANRVFSAIEKFIEEKKNGR